MTVLQLATKLAEPARILIVDDDVPVCRLLQRCLTDIGCATETAHSGFEALHALATQKFDGVLLDIRIPEPDGFAVVEDLRDKGIDIPVIVITGYPDERVYRLIDRFGVLAVIAKPIGYDEMVQALRRYFSIFKLKHRPAYLEHGRLQSANAAHAGS